MRLKVRENLLFFAPVGEKDGRLFALTTPVDVSEEAANGWKARPDELRDKFERAIGNCEWGRCVFARFGSSVGWRPRMPMVMALVHLDGRVWIRRLFDDQMVRAWVDWKDAPSFGLELAQFCRWPHARTRRFLLSQIARELRAPLTLHLSGAADKRRVFGPVWVKGNEESMLLWLKLAAQVFAGSNPPLFKSYSQTQGVGFTAHAGNAALVPFVECNGLFFHPTIRPLLRLWELILREHRVFGCASYHTPYQDLKGFTRFGFSISSETPTQHERLEAMMRLRDAVRGSSIEKEVEAILRGVQF